MRTTAFAAMKGGWVCTGTSALSHASTTCFSTGRPRPPDTPAAVHWKDNFKMSSADPKVTHMESSKLQKCYSYHPNPTCSSRVPNKMVKNNTTILPLAALGAMGLQKLCMNLFLPGHDCVLHPRLSRRSPWHAFPPCLGSGCVQLRERS